MTGNRLTSGASAATTAKHLKPGDILQIPIKDFQTGADTGRFYKLHRTNRDYVFDICDAYNDGMTDSAKERGLRWRVTGTGELKLGSRFEPAD